MAAINPPQSAKLLVGMLSAYPAAFDMARVRLEKQFGAVDLASPDIQFTFTQYYENEMGAGLIRRFIAFQELIDPGILPDTKLFTNQLESEIAQAGEYPVKRPVNLDPGYITPAKLVLASAKDFSHRIYLRDGIYAEVTLHYKKSGSFESRPWTFPDYAASPEYHAFLLEARRRCCEQLNGESDRK